MSSRARSDDDQPGDERPRDEGAREVETAREAQVERPAAVAEHLQAEIADVLGLRRRGEDRVRVGADRVEPDHAGVEEPGEPSLQIEREREEAEDQHDAGEEHEIGDHLAPLAPLAEETVWPHDQDQQQ